MGNKTPWKLITQKNFNTNKQCEKLSILLWLVTWILSTLTSKGWVNFTRCKSFCVNILCFFSDNSGKRQVTVVWWHGWRLRTFMIIDLLAQSLGLNSYLFRQSLLITITSQTVTELTLCKRTVCYTRYTYVTSHAATVFKWFHHSKLLLKRHFCNTQLSVRQHHGHAYSYLLPVSSI